jgi:cell division protease FtsH
LIDGAHDRARFILSTHRSTLDRLATSLVEKETLDDADLAQVFGDIDKGAGIEVPVDELELGTARPAPREPAVTVAEVSDQPDVWPARAPVLPAWRRVLRWGLREPRPSGT